MGMGLGTRLRARALYWKRYTRRMRSGDETRLMCINLNYMSIPMSEHVTIMYSIRLVLFWLYKIWPCGHGKYMYVQNLDAEAIVCYSITWAHDDIIMIMHFWFSLPLRYFLLILCRLAPMVTSLLEHAKQLALLQFSYPPVPITTL